jgi:hypothetical protein
MARPQVIEAEERNIVQAIAAGGLGQNAALAAGLKDRQHERETVSGELARLDGLVRAGQVDRRGLTATLLVSEWRTMLGDRPEIARQALTKLLVSRLTFTPMVEPDGTVFFVFEGRAGFAPLLAGVVDGVPMSSAASNLARQSLTSGGWCPRRDSNPCFQIENLGSWASLDDGDATLTLTYTTPSGKAEGSVPL